MPTKTTLLALPSTLRPTLSKPPSAHLRTLHRLNAPPPRIPHPTPFVPDVPTFLTLIGRNLRAQASKIPSWEALFSLSGHQLRESGIEPARARRYLMWWRERFRNGIAGIGGDLKFVKDGEAELRLVQVRVDRESGFAQRGTVTRDAGVRKVVVNTLPSSSESDHVARSPSPTMEAGDVERVKEMRVYQGTQIGGRGVELVKGGGGGVARLKVQEGLWEERRGHKVDGGERRKAMVRAKRRVAENKLKR